MSPTSPSESGYAYRGRFAPTPSGPLHLGSLLTALASFLQARTQGGMWLLRLDDLDRPRCVAGADTLILQQLEAHGLQWDEQPRRQSEHLDEYRTALSTLERAGQLYACACTRAVLQRDSSPGPDGPVYGGHCRNLGLSADSRALRLRVIAGDMALDDPWQGILHRDAERDIGDFIVRRADGVTGYQLACVVDEAAQGSTEVVRGADLIGSSLRQCIVQQRLQLPTPRYRHLPVLLDAAGRKLSKQNHARALDIAQAGDNLLRCLCWLRQNPPESLRGASATDVLGWALDHWQPASIDGHATPMVEHSA